VLEATNAIGYFLQFSAVSSAYPGQVCVTEQDFDFLTCYNSGGTQLYRNSGSSWPDTYIASTTGFYCSFTTDVSDVVWGIYFVVYAECDVGNYFLYTSGGCVACPGGTYMPSTNIYPASCSPCGVDMYSTTGQSGCSSCPVGSSTLALSSQASCTCDPGKNMRFIYLNVHFLYPDSAPVFKFSWRRIRHIICGRGRVKGTLNRDQKHRCHAPRAEPIHITPQPGRLHVSAVRLEAQHKVPRCKVHALATRVSWKSLVFHVSAIVGIYTCLC